MKPTADLYIREVFESLRFKLTVKTDRMFAGLLTFEWILVLSVALWVHAEHHGSRGDLHIWLALSAVSLAAALPLPLISRRTGTALNRCVAAGLAIAAHFVPGLCFEGTVQGTWRPFEHGSWIVFETTILIISTKAGLDTLWMAAEQQVGLERTLSAVEIIVEARTRELEESQALITEQQAALVNSAKLSALGEMAGGIAHEINTPLAVISMRAEQLGECLDDGCVQDSDIRDTVEVINSTVSRITKIVNGLRLVSHEGKKCPMKVVPIATIIDDTLSFCRERFSNHDVQLHVEMSQDVRIEAACRSIEISQVLLNLLNNAYDAIQPLSERWVRVELKESPEAITISVTDSGAGIPPELREKVMSPFFTTKEVGKGTGLGLSISQSIMNEHNGSLSIDEDAPNTRFVVWMPKYRDAELREVI